MMMMAFGEQTGKRTGQDPIGLEPKKRKVEFVVPEDGDDKEFTAEMYKRFLKTALSDLEKVWQYTSNFLLICSLLT